MSQQLMQEAMARMEMRMQFATIKNCFTDCVQNFRDDALSSGEKTCLQNCASRDLQAFQAMAAIQNTIQQRSGMQGGGSPQF